MTCPRCDNDTFTEYAHGCRECTECGARLTENGCEWCDRCGSQSVCPECVGG